MISNIHYYSSIDLTKIDRENDKQTMKLYYTF